MTRRTKFTLYLVGMALLLVSLAYIGKSIAENWSSVEQVQVLSVPWLLACIGSYAISHLSTGLAWPLAVRQLGVQLSIRDGVRIGLVAQIGKYLPGNVAHYAGRGGLAMQFDIPLKSSAISTVVELGSALAAMVMVGTIGLIINPRPIAWLPAPSVSGILALAAGLFGLALLGLWLWRKGAQPHLLIGPTLCIAASFALSGFSIFALALALGLEGLSLTVSISAFALAWGAGFVVPGAPAGIGIREATLLALLNPMIGTGPAIAVAILHRLITSLVDAVAALIGYAWLTLGSFAKK